MLAQHHLNIPTFELQDQISSSEPTPSSPELSTSLNEDGTSKKIGKWTSKEDDLLRKYVPLYGEKQWRKISECIPGRTSIQCLHRWTKILKPGLVKGPWSAEEDQKLISWVKAEGPNKWAQCANFIYGRSGKQCRERWFNNLNPDVKKGSWSKEEDELIFQLYQKHGSSWSKIAKFISGRTENAIKNRFYSTLRRLTADKKKDETEKQENVSSGEEKKDLLDLGLAAQTPSALYLLLNGKTSTVLPSENAKKETSAASKKHLESTAHQSEKPKHHSFNINGEKVVVLRDAKPNEKSSQEDANRNAETDDNDSVFEDFLNSFNVAKVPCVKPENTFHFDALQEKIQSFCKTNIKDLGETAKSLDVSKTSTATSVSSPLEVNVKPFSLQPQRSASAVEAPKTRGNLIITPTPNDQTGFSLKVPQAINKSISCPAKGLGSNGFSLYNPLNANANVSGLSLLTRASSNQSAENFSDLRSQYTTESKINVGQNWGMGLNMIPQNHFARNLAAPLQMMPMNMPVAPEKNIYTMYRQMFSLDMLLAKAKNDMIYYQTCARQNEMRNLIQEANRQGLRPVETLNSEFEQVMKKKKVE